MPMLHPALESTKIKSVDLKNRFSVAPMSRVSANGDGVPTQQMANYYQRYAQGGFSLLITVGTYTDRYYSQAYPNQPGITNDHQQKGWEISVDCVHQHDAKILLQLMHAGALSQHLSNTRAPSAIQPLRTMLPGYSVKQGPYPFPQAMNLSEIDGVIEGFLQSAIRAEQAGFDGVEIHAANGYLLDQFITDYTNYREDQYGGSLENRIRLSVEIIEAIKQNVSSDFLVGIRLSQGKVNDFDYLWSGGLNDGKMIFNAVANAGVDMIHFASEGMGFDHGCLTREGQSLPQQARMLTHLPLIANGGLDDPNEAKRILEEGHADLISLAKGALVNPDWVLKLSNNCELVPFNSGVFSEGVTIDAQYRWESEQHSELD